MSIEIKKNVLLAPQTTFKIGGKADFFVETKNDDEIIEAVKYAKENNLKVFILGGGSNVLISDNGFGGLVIKIKNDKINLNDCEIVCGAGVVLMDLVNFSIKNNLVGLEWAAGIPGTVGGAVRGNAGAFGEEMKNCVVEIKVLDMSKNPLKIKNINAKEANFSYRSSVVKENADLVLISVKIKLKSKTVEDSVGIVKDILKKRSEKQPVGLSAGSFFKNPIVKNSDIIEKFEHDMEMKMREDKLPAGWFIDDLGFRGKQIGGAKVSEKHANFIINTGNAKAEDVIILSSFLKQKVRDSYGVQLEEEVNKIGF